MGGLTDRAFDAVVACTAVGAGVVAGVCFAFSTFVMPALARLPAREGMSAMQSINAALGASFLGVFIGTGLGAAFIGVCAVARWSSRTSPFLLGGALLYVLGTVFVTGVGNVPLNDALAAVSAESVEGAALWTRFLREWTAWNHLRVVAALAASTSFVLAVVGRGRAPSFFASP